MKIAFHGAARTVTGSKHLLTLSNGRKYLLDCGMFQGLGQATNVLNRNWGFEPADVDYLDFIACPYRPQRPYSQAYTAMALPVKYFVRRPPRS